MSPDDFYMFSIRTASREHSFPYRGSYRKIYDCRYCLKREEKEKGVLNKPVILVFVHAVEAPQLCAL